MRVIVPANAKKKTLTKFVNKNDNDFILNSSPSTYPLPKSLQWLLVAVSFLFVAWGQPAWHSLTGPLAAIFGYALFWRVLLIYPSKKKRFFLGMLWFSAVQLVQLSWFIAHPYWYIYFVYVFLAVMMGIQFGILSIFAYTNRKVVNATTTALFIAALWTIFEWSRLFFLSGFSFNPVGLALTSNSYSLQMASLAGILGLSFWVIFVNVLSLLTWIQPTKRRGILLGSMIFIPYIYGAAQIAFHEQTMKASPPPYFRAVLVQTAFEIEEVPDSLAQGNLETYVFEEWKRILEITKKNLGQPIDLIVLPEFVVPFGTYAFVYPLDEVVNAFKEILGDKILHLLPKAEWPLAFKVNGSHGSITKVNNAYWVQALANSFDADVIAGLQDAEQKEDKKIEYYSGALFFHPTPFQNNNDLFIERYEKQVLVPMGEYIPFSFMRGLAAEYGITSSFTCGRGAKVFSCQGIGISPSICYEETFGHLICEGRQKGAQLLVNLTSDVWYPHSCLPHQHLDHARPRTVENGVPLIRACNTGITGAIDSLGRDIAILGGSHPEDFEWVADSILVDVPLYHYKTLYSFWGDYPLIIFCLSTILYCGAVNFCVFRSDKIKVDKNSLTK